MMVVVQEKGLHAFDMNQCRERIDVPPQQIENHVVLSFDLYVLHKVEYFCSWCFGLMTINIFLDSGF